MNETFKHMKLFAFLFNSRLRGTIAGIPWTYMNNSAKNINFDYYNCEHRNHIYLRFASYYKLFMVVCFLGVFYYSL